MAESIYKWIVPDPVKPAKEPLYKSQAYTQPVTCSTLRVGAVGKEGTFGKEVKTSVRPDNFMKAHEKSGFVDSKSLRESSILFFCEGREGERLSLRRHSASLPPPHPTAPPFTRTRELSASGIPPPRSRAAVETRAPRDFVTENAIAAILASPRTKAKAAERDWMKVPGFGKRPAYLDQIGAALAAEREYVLELMGAAQREARVNSTERHLREMGDDERSDLIMQLKEKFTEVNHVSLSKFLILSFLHFLIHLLFYTLPSLNLAHQCLPFTPTPHPFSPAQRCTRTSKNLDSNVFSW